MTQNSSSSRSAVTVLFFSVCAITQQSRIDLAGQAAMSAAADRAIVIMAGTRHVNAEGEKIVRFIVDDGEFAWNVNTAGTVGSFDLNDVVPPMSLHQHVRAYVSSDPKYMGGGNRDK